MIKIAFLPNWCKYVSLLLLVASVIVDIGGLRKGFEAGREAANSTLAEESNGAGEGLTFSELMNEELENVRVEGYLSDLLIMLSMVVYILSKDKKDDEYINIIRARSLLIALLIGIVSCFIAYGFSYHIQGILLLLIQFFSYIIVFKIGKIASDPWLKAGDEDE